MSVDDSTITGLPNEITSPNDDDLFVVDDSTDSDPQTKTKKIKLGTLRDSIHGLTTKGDLLTHDDTDTVRLPVGANGRMLVADDSTDEGIAWSSAADFTEGTASRGSKVVATEPDGSSKSHLEEDISSLQSGANTHNDNLSYKEGNFTVFDGQLQRALVGIPAGEPFDKTNWSLSSGFTNIVNVITAEDLPDRAPAIFTHVENNGLGDARFIATGNTGYNDKQETEISNSLPVSAYNGNRIMDKSTAFFNTPYADISLDASITSPNGMAVNHVTKKGYVCNNLTSPSLIQVFDLKTNQKLNLITLAATANPRFIAVNTKTNLVYASHQSNNNISVIDGDTDLEIATIDVGSSSGKLAVNEETNRIYVQTVTTVKVIDGKTNAIVATLDEGWTNINAIDVNKKTNRIYVVDRFPDELTVIDGNTNIIIGNKIEFNSVVAEGIFVNETTNKIYVSLTNDNEVAVVDGDTNLILSIIPVAGLSGAALIASLSGNSSNNMVYLSGGVIGTRKIFVIDGRTDTLVDTLSDIDDAEILDVDIETNQLYAVNNGATNTISVINVSPANKNDVTISTGFDPDIISLNHITNRIYVTNFNGEQIQVFNGFTNILIATIKNGIGAFPSSVAINLAKNLIFVTSQFDNTISKINGATNTIIGSPLPIADTPIGAVVDQNTDQIFVCRFDADRVDVVDNDSFTIDDTIIVGSRPVAVAVNNDTDEVYVCNSGTTTVTQFNGTTHNITRTITVQNEPVAVAVNEVTDKIYVANFDSNSVSVIDGPTGNIDATITVGSNPDGISVNPTTNLIYVVNQVSNTMSIINGSDNTVIQTLPIGGTPGDVVVHPFSDVVYTTSLDNEEILVLNPDSFSVVGLPFSLTAHGDLRRTVDLDNAYIMGAQINTAIGYTLPAGTRFAIVSPNPAVNTINMTGSGQTWLTAPDFVQMNLEVRVIDNTNSNKLFDVTIGEGAIAGINAQKLNVFNFNDLGSLTNASMVADTFVAFGFNVGLKLFDASSVITNSSFIPNNIADLVSLTIKNLTTTSTKRVVIRDVFNPTPPQTTFLDIDAKTPLTNEVIIDGTSGDVLGDYFKKGTELAGTVDSFQTSGESGIHTQINISGHLFTDNEQTIELADSIFYNRRYPILSVDAGNSVTIDKPFQGNVTGAKYRQVRNITNYQPYLLDTGAVSSILENQAGGQITVIGLIDPALENGSTVTLAGVGAPYDGTHIIFNSEVDQFDIPVAHTTDRGPAGTWTANKTQITVIDHMLTNGISILLKESKDYPKGYSVEHEAGDTIVINAPFRTNESVGIISDASLDQTALNVEVKDAKGIADSMKIGGWFYNGTTSTPILDGVFSPLNMPDNGGVIPYAENERFTEVDSVTGAVRFDGLKPTTISLLSVLSVEKTGGTQSYDLRYAISRVSDQIATARVVVGGTGFVDAETIGLTGDISGADDATATIEVTGGVITAINLVFRGTKYRADEPLTVTGGSGSGATALVNNFVALTTPVVKRQEITTTNKDIIIFQKIRMNTGDVIRKEMAGVATTNPVIITSGLQDMDG